MREEVIIVGLHGKHLKILEKVSRLGAVDGMLSWDCQEGLLDSEDCNVARVDDKLPR